MARWVCVADNKGYRHTLRIYNTYRFSMATVVMRTRLGVTLCVCCLSGLICQHWVLPDEAENRIKDTQTTHVYTHRHALYLHNFRILYHSIGDRGSTVVKVLCYKFEGRWFDSRWCHWNFSLT